jgi:hypothetical protein
MEIVELVGERMYLDYLITSTFNYSYLDNKIALEYNSYLEVLDIENKISLLQSILDDTINDKDSSQNVSRLTTAIQILTDLKNRLI